MHAEAVAEDILAFVRKHFPSPRTRTIAHDDALLETGIVDSLGVLDLVAFLERQYGITVVDEDLVPANFGTVAGMALLVQHKSNPAAPPAAG
jgi:acyl carrier protein